MNTKDVYRGTLRTLVDWQKKKEIGSGKNELWRRAFMGRDSYTIDPITAQEILTTFEKDVPELLTFRTAIPTFLREQIESGKKLNRI